MEISVAIAVLVVLIVLVALLGVAGSIDQPVGSWTPTSGLIRRRSLRRAQRMRGPEGSVRWWRRWEHRQELSER